MNDQKIYEAIALNGPMTAAALAIEMGAEVDDTIEHLAALRGVGDLVLADGFYSFSRPFGISEDCRRARAKAATVMQARAAGGTTPLDRALNFLLARGGECTSADLHAALCLGPDELPSTVLADALAAHRLFKEGKMWRLDRRTTPRKSPSLSVTFEDELNSGLARRAQQITGNFGNGGLRETCVVPIKPENPNAAPLDWKPAPDCNSGEEVDC